MKIGLLELLLSLSSTGSGSEKAVNQTRPVQPPAIASSSRPEANWKSKAIVDEEVRRLVKRVAKLLRFDGNSGNGP